MVLNALSIDPKRPWKGSWRWFHEQLLDCCLPLDTVAQEGVVLTQVPGIFLVFKQLKGLTMLDTRLEFVVQAVVYVKCLVTGVNLLFSQVDIGLRWVRGLEETQRHGRTMSWLGDSQRVWWFMPAGRVFIDLDTPVQSV